MDEEMALLEQEQEAEGLVPLEAEDLDMYDFRQFEDLGELEGMLSEAVV